MFLKRIVVIAFIFPRYIRQVLIPATVGDLTFRRLVSALTDVDKDGRRLQDERATVSSRDCNIAVKRVYSSTTEHS